MTIPFRRLPPAHELADAELIEAIRKGEPWALGEMYDRHGGRLYRIALRLTGNAADAEDVVHDVFVAMPELLRRYVEQGALSQWLARITGRTALMRLRAQHRRREDDLIPADNVADASDARVGQTEAFVDIERAVAALPEALRQVLALRFIDDLSHDDIAVILGISAGASRARLNRAIAHVRKAVS